MTASGEFDDPRLVTLYDTLFPAGVDTQFWLSVADEQPGVDVLDLGCGTGMLAVELARRGHRVTGADPAPRMLEVARTRAGGELVRWLDGDASVLAGAGVTGVGLTVMTSHVVQAITDDDALAATFAAVRAVSTDDARLVFDTRSGDAASWLANSRYLVPRTRHRDDGGDVVLQQESLAADGPLARYRLRYHLVATGEDLSAEGVLRFRTLDEITSLLHDASFAVDAVYGDWDRRPPDGTTTELLITASCRRP